jgi:hypothetical protein
MKTIKIYLIKDRETGLYYTEAVADVPATTIKNVFDSLTATDGTILMGKFRHTKGYLFKKKIKSFIKRTASFFKAIKDAYNENIGQEFID